MPQFRTFLFFSLLSTFHGSINHALAQSGEDDYNTTLRYALSGDYQSRRNMAFCFRNGPAQWICKGWPRPQPIEACAWRYVVLMSGDRKVDDLDTDAFKIDCRKLDAAEILAAEAKANRYITGKQ